MLFRSGGAGVVLSNKFYFWVIAKYLLTHVERTQCADDDSYKSVFETEDVDNNRGVALSKEITHHAGKCIGVNLRAMATRALPLLEKLKVAASRVQRRRNKHAKPYVPHITALAQHLCIHAGGRGVLDALEEHLELSKETIEPSRKVLYQRGNTSSSSIWYELQCLEEMQRVRSGDRVLQLAFGSGFKANSAIWRKL